MRIKCTCIVWLIFSFTVKANTGDTLGMAKSFIEKGRFRKAEKLLAAYEKAHANDLNILWLHAQTAYWAGQIKKSQTSYQKAINRFPSNYYLKLDYALKLVENGEVERAKPILELYKKYDANNADLKIASARLMYWEGDYKAALQLLNTGSVAKEKPKETQALKEEIRRAQSPWIKLNVDYISDDQPLRVITPGIEAGIYINNQFSPSVSVQDALFKTDTSSSSSPGMLLGNKFQFFKAHCFLNVRGGAVQLPDKTTTGVIGLDVTKISFRHLEIGAQVSRMPYLITVSSLSKKVVPYHFALNAGWNNTASWNGKISGSIDQFTDDDNYMYTIGAWLFAPPFRLPALQFRLGYAYGYSDSKENRYIARESIKTIVSNYLTTKTVSGVYDPYFTPNHQQVHAVLFNMSYNRNKKLELGVNASIAFIGNTNDPYLFLDKTSNNELFVSRGYTKVNFYPNKLDAYLLYKLTAKSSLKATYSFLNNNFYTSHTAGISWIINFWNE